jgi:hypothetical protein
MDGIDGGVKVEGVLEWGAEQNICAYEGRVTGVCMKINN